MELNSEQIAYLKSLNSKKKKRKFLLNCLIEDIEKECSIKECEATINFIRRTYPKDTCLINIVDKWESIRNKS